MVFNEFKDRLFEVLNESDELSISDIAGDDRKNTFTLEIVDGSVFEIECREIPFKRFG